MGARGESVLTRALLLLALCPGAAAQELWHDAPGGLGVVVDESGAPIAGADVRLVVRQPDPAWASALRALLARYPLPRTVSAADGGFFLPLAPEQRAAGLGQPGAIALVVDKPGWTGWIEPLPDGLHGWLGSRVVLRRPDPRDRVELRIADPRPGMRLLIHHASEPLLAQEHAVPADGKLAIDLPLLPNPIRFGQMQRLELRLTAQLLHPEVASRAVAIEPAAGPVEFAPPLAGERSRRPVVRADARPIEGLRGLYRGPDRRLRWFPLGGGDAPENEFCRLVAVHADGCRATMQLDPCVLQPAVEPRAAQALRITGAGGEPLAGAIAELHPLSRWPGREGLPPGERPLARAVAAGDGRLSLPAPAADEPLLLRVTAPGHRERLDPDPAGLADPATLALEPLRGGSLRIRVATKDEAPVADALLLLGFQDGGVGSFARTDSRGTATFAPVPDRPASLLCIAPGFERRQTDVRVPGDSHAVAVLLEPAAVLRAQIVTPDGAPVPFAMLRDTARQPGLSRPEGLLETDSLGRVLRPDASIARPTQLQRWPMHVGQFFEWSGEPEPVTWTADAPTALLLEFVPPVRITQESWFHSNGSGSSSPGQNREPLRRLVVRWAGPGCSLQFDREDAPPIRIDQALLDATKQIGPLRRIEVGATRRRIPLIVRGADGARLLDFACTPRHPHHGANWYRLDGNGFRLREGDATFFTATDRGAWHARVLHPDHLPAELQVPAGDDDRPLEVQLEQGSRVELLLPAERARTSWMMTMQQAGRGEMLYFWFAASETGAAEPLVRIPLPAALPAGKWQIKNLPAPLQARSFETDGRQPLTIDLSRGGR